MAARGADGEIRNSSSVGSRAPSRLRAIALLSAAAALAAGCNATTGADRGFGYAQSSPPVQVATPEIADYHVGKPYQIAGRWYHPKEEPGYDSVGKASWYGPDFHGRRTASGEVYDMNALSAAHPTLPIPTYARVTNLDNGRSIVVRVNDRGPFTRGREIDLSRRAAQVLDFKGNGTAEVRVQYVGAAPRDGEEGWLTTTVRQNGAPVAPVMVASGTAEPDEAEPQLAEGADQATAPAPLPNERPMALRSAPSSGGGENLRTAFGLAPGFAPERPTNVVAETFALFEAEGQPTDGQAYWR